MKTIGILFVSALLFAGCKKKEEPAAGTASGSSAMGSSMGSAAGSDTGSAMGSAAGSGSDMGSAAGSGSAMAGSGSDMGSAAAGSGGGTAMASGPIKDDADYQARGEAMVDEMTGIFVADGTDCKKLATDINAFVDKNGPMVKEAKAYEKAHPAAKKAFDAKMKPKQKDMLAKVGPSMKACAKDKDVQAAMKKMDMK